MEHDPSDARVIADSLADPDAFTLLWERHLMGVGTFLSRRVGVELAEDLVAEVFARAFRGRGSFRPSHPTARPWLFGIATHVVADHRRAERRRLDALRRYAIDAAVAGDVGRAAGAGGVAGVDGGARLLSRDLVEALRRLPEVDRDTLLLVVWGELSYEEAASALGVPIGTVRSRIARARQRLGLSLMPARTGRSCNPRAESPEIVNGESHA